MSDKKKKFTIKDAEERLNILAYNKNKNLVGNAQAGGDLLPEATDGTPTILNTNLSNYLNNFKLLTDDVTTICSEWRLAEILAALSILANSSPPNKLFNAFVSPGKTESVSIVSESFGVLITSMFSFLSKAKR